MRAASPRFVRMSEPIRTGNVKPTILLKPLIRGALSPASSRKPMIVRFFTHSSSSPHDEAQETLNRRKTIRDYVKKHHKGEHKEFGDDVIAMVERKERDKVGKEASEEDKEAKHDPEDDIDVNLHDTLDHQFVFRDMTLEEVIVMKEHEQLEKKLKAESDISQEALQKHIDFHRAAGVLPGGLKARLYHVKENDSVYDAIEVMLKHGIGCVLVLSSDSDAPPVGKEAGKELEVDHYRGMLTTRDFLHKVVKPAKDIKTTLVGEVMDTSPVFSDAHENCLQTLSLMLQNNSRHVLVRKEGKVIGLVAKADLLKKLYKDYKESTGYLLDYVQGGY